MSEVVDRLVQMITKREVVSLSGERSWKVGNRLEIGWRETLFPEDVATIKTAAGLGAMLLDLHLVDYTIGSRQDSEDSKSIWLLDGRRVDLSSLGGAGFMASATKKADPEKPEPAFRDWRPSGSGKIRKCLHPDCQIEVDITKKKSGCCCKAHMNFECEHPTCLVRATVNGWAKATHPFGTKIAKEHWQYRKEAQP